MTDTKKRLGRGLDSLLSPTRLQQIDRASSLPPASTAVSPPAAPGPERIVELPLDRITPNPHQPRQTWDQAKLQELAASIRATGLVQPILVRPMGRGYQLIAGERRLRACQIAQRATITAIIRDPSEDQMLEWALVENIHRTDLNPIERARAYKNYLQRLAATQEQAAARLGEDRSTIANYVRLLDLPPELRTMLAQGQLTMGHARALLGLSPPALQTELARSAHAHGWSVRTLEQRVRALRRDPPRPRAPQQPHIAELETQLTQIVGTKVTIHTRGRQPQRGTIVIEFYNLDDFDRIQAYLRTGAAAVPPPPSDNMESSITK